MLAPVSRRGPPRLGPHAGRRPQPRRPRQDQSGKNINKMLKCAYHTVLFCYITSYFVVFLNLQNGFPTFRVPYWAKQEMASAYDWLSLTFFVPVSKAHLRFFLLY